RGADRDRVLRDPVWLWRVDGADAAPAGHRAPTTASRGARQSRGLDQCAAGRLDRHGVRRIDERGPRRLGGNDAAKDDGPGDWKSRGRFDGRGDDATAVEPA